MDLENFDPDAYLAANPDPVQPQAVPVDETQLRQFDPDAYLDSEGVQEVQQDITRNNDLQAQYGTLPQQALAWTEAKMRGLTLGTSDFGFAALTSPEAVKARQEANPWTAGVGSMVGGGALLALTGGIANPVSKAVTTGLAEKFGAEAAKNLAGKAAAGAIGLSAEGGLFGFGNVMSDLALGDPELNAQKVMSHLKWGAGIGVGVGGALKGITMAPALARAAKAKFGKGAAAEGAAAAEGPLEAAAESWSPSAIDGVDVMEEPIVKIRPDAKPATTLKELQAQLKESETYWTSEDLEALPQRKEAKRIAEALNASQEVGPVPFNQLQIDAFKSDANYLHFKTLAEMPGKEGDAIRKMIRTQKNVMTDALEQRINKIATDYKPTSDATEAGQRVAENLTKQMEGIRKEIGPIIGALKKTKINNVDHLPGVLEYLMRNEEHGNLGIADMFEMADKGFKIKPYNTGMNIDKQTHSAIKTMIDGIESNPRDFGRLFNVREGLESGIDLTKTGKAQTELGRAKAAMMEYLQDMIQQYVPDAGVREIFKQYAINEKNVEFVEKAIGAKIGDNWKSLANNKSEAAIINKMFAHDGITNAMKEIMHPEDFKKALADYLKVTKHAIEDKNKGAFSANQFYSAIQKGPKKEAMNAAFEDRLGYQGLLDLVNGMRIFTDDMPINPSGTAKTIWGQFQKWLEHPSQGMHLIKEYISDKAAKKSAGMDINAALSEAQALNTENESANIKMGIIQRMIKKTNDAIGAGVKEIYNNKAARDAVRGVFLGTTYSINKSKYDANIKTLKDFSADPEKLMDELSENSEGLYQAAPNITQGINNTVIQGINFLSNKIPTQPQSYPLSADWEPTKVQMNQFNSYVQAVNDPIGALEKVKQGTLDNQTMEALQVVYPQLLQEMRRAVMYEMKPEKAKKLPYAQKMSLGKFLGQPLDASMTPQGIMSNQIGINTQMSQQNLPNQGRKSNQGGLKQLNAAGRAQTKATDQRKEE